jgi:hypothetical protein
MASTTAAAVSPFNCRWIVRGSEHRLGRWNYAICVRVRNADRLVNECDCSRCARWEEPTDQEESPGILP